MVFEVVLILKMVIEPMCNISFSKIKTLVCLQHKKYVQILLFFPPEIHYARSTVVGCSLLAICIPV